MTGSDRSDKEDILSESEDPLKPVPESNAEHDSNRDSVSTSTEAHDDNTETDDDEALLLRERKTPEGLLVAVCDSDCLGETYVDGEVSLNVTESFYGGSEADKVDAETVIKRLKRASVANIVGKHAVAIAVEAGIVEKDRVLQIDETLHAQLVWM